MISRDEWRWALLWGGALVIMASLPYLVASLATPSELFYAGFLSNPEDGNAYLAKMQQGLRGEWLYRLPYTAEPHKGEFLFTYYILLGHVARWTRLPLLWVFHLARVMNGFFLLMIVYYGVACLFEERSHRRFAFLLTAVGSGFGWLAAILGVMTVDMWVPEGYIFYSVFVNPHFPLGIALMVLSILWSTVARGSTLLDWRWLIALVLCTTVLGVVQPFCILTVGVALLLYAVARWVQTKRVPWPEGLSGVVIGMTGLPFAINAYLASTRNPAFAAWSAQNQTLSPPVWDYAIGYGLVLLLALPGLWVAMRRREPRDVLLACWALGAAVLLYAPWSLQRRLIMGWIVPLGSLATMGWYALPKRLQLRKAVLWSLASLTHLFLIGITLVGVLTRSEHLYMSRDERDALVWLAEEAAPSALVIAAPQTGLYIPAWAGQRVFYGHRFETVNADVRLAQLTAFFQYGDHSLLQERRVDYVFYGPRERALSGEDWQPDRTWGVAYRLATVTIYALSGE